MHSCTYRYDKYNNISSNPSFILLVRSFSRVPVYTCTWVHYLSSTTQRWHAFRKIIIHCKLVHAYVHNIDLQRKCLYILKRSFGPGVPRDTTIFCELQFVSLKTVSRTYHHGIRCSSSHEADTSADGRKSFKRIV